MELMIHRCRQATLSSVIVLQTERKRELKEIQEEIRRASGNPPADSRLDTGDRSCSLTG